MRHLIKNGCQLLREGGRHSIYWNPANRKTSSIPRHREISDKLVLKIYKDLGIIT
ncbi:MAG: type II toxin-antitoxin system HicA family toxin [Candidatus Eremiobacterota bacterium]